MAYFSYMKIDPGAQRISVENGPLNVYLRSNSLRSTERKLFSLYTNTNSYKDNTEFDGLVAQAIKQLALLTKSHLKA